jgi:hypothetical protein
LRIEDYFQHLQQAINACLVIQSSTITFDKRSTHTGFIHGEIWFVDGSTLHLREFVDVEIDIDRLMYAYQYMNSAKALIFRYDNTGHHKKFNLPTYPNHKHDSTQDNVVASSAPDLAAVLYEIEQQVQLP